MANEIKAGEPAKGKEVQKVEPARALSPFDEMDRMFDNFFRHGWMRPWRMELPTFPEFRALEGKLPKVDVVDREADVLVRAELPGVDRKDVDVSVTDNTVTVKGSTRHEEKEERGDYYRREISSGSFSRTVALPAEVDGSKAKAEFKDGILELVLPKVEKSKRHSVKVE
jgi:HSP20 family protein